MTEKFSPMYKNNRTEGIKECGLACAVVETIGKALGYASVHDSISSEDYVKLRQEQNRREK